MLDCITIFFFSDVDHPESIFFGLYFCCVTESGCPKELIFDSRVQVCIFDEVLKDVANNKG